MTAAVPDAIDDIAIVVDLACLTEDRTPEEQRALLRVAALVDPLRVAQAEESWQDSEADEATP